MAIRQVTATIIKDTRYHKNLGSVCIFFFRASIIQIIANTSASVNMILFQFGSKNTLDVHISNGTSDIIPNTRSVPKYLHRFLVLKYPSTNREIKIGNAILPNISNSSLITIKALLLKYMKNVLLT